MCATYEFLHSFDPKWIFFLKIVYFDPHIISFAVEAAKKRNITVKVFQIKCPLHILQARDKNRPGVKEGCRKPLGDETIEKLYNQLENTFYPEAIALDTEKNSTEECVRIIKENVGLKQ